MGTMGRRSILISQLFFTHYRARLMEELLECTDHDVLLCGADYDVDQAGIKAWLPSDRTRFIPLTTLKLMNRFYLQWGLVSLALRSDISAIVYTGNSKHLTTWVSAIVARMTGKRVLFWTHGWLRQEYGLKRRIRCAFYGLADGLLLYGNRAKQIGIQSGFDPDRLYVIFNSLDYQTQSKLRATTTATHVRATRASLFATPGSPLLICVARLIKQRKLDQLLSAMALLRERGVSANLLLVGEGPERCALERMAEELDLPVAFVGECYDETQLCHYFMASNVTVLPGAAGLTTIHSLTYGTPVISNDNFDEQMPEIEAIIPGITGEFYGYDDIGDLARVIEKWIGTGLPDETTRKQCYDVVERYYAPAFQMSVIKEALSGTPAKVEGHLVYRTA
jgi:1,2-diacylglycerol 3-alpha-glucosyltransferase